MPTCQTRRTVNSSGDEIIEVKSPTGRKLSLNVSRKYAKLTWPEKELVEQLRCSGCSGLGLSEWQPIELTVEGMSQFRMMTAKRV